MIYKTTRRCDNDVGDLYVHGALNFGIKQAERYHEGLIATFSLVAATPTLARLRHELKPPVRLHPYRSHMIVYVEYDDAILILRVLHGRQDWAKHLPP